MKGVFNTAVEAEMQKQCHFEIANCRGYKVAGHEYQQLGERISVSFSRQGRDMETEQPYLQFTVAYKPQ